MVSGIPQSFRYVFRRLFRVVDFGQDEGLMVASFRSKIVIALKFKEKTGRWVPGYVKDLSNVFLSSGRNPYRPMGRFCAI